MTFLENLKQLPKMLSFWVAAVGAGLVAMPADLQQQLFSVFPGLGVVAPLLWLGAFAVARATPQSSVKE